MLTAKYRLNRKKEISKVLKEGKSFLGTNFSFKILKNKNLYPRFAIAASKKIFKKATLRNRAKRRVKAAILKILSEIPVFFDVVIFPKKTVLSERFENLVQELRDFFKTFQND